MTGADPVGADPGVLISGSDARRGGWVPVRLAAPVRIPTGSAVVPRAPDDVGPSGYPRGDEYRTRPRGGPTSTATGHEESPDEQADRADRARHHLSEMRRPRPRRHQQIPAARPTHHVRAL